MLRFYGKPSVLNEHFGPLYLDGLLSQKRLAIKQSDLLVLLLQAPGSRRPTISIGSRQPAWVTNENAGWSYKDAAIQDQVKTMPKILRGVDQKPHFAAKRAIILLSMLLLQSSCIPLSRLVTFARSALEKLSLCSSTPRNTGMN
jgi:hypothetical protein